MDPWREAAQQIATKIDSVSQSGVVIVGHPRVLQWDEFLTVYTDTSGEGGYDRAVRGWQIVEPEGDSFQSQGQTLGEAVEIKQNLIFSIRGFREFGQDPDQTQEEFRDMVWEVMKALDGLHDFTFTDPSISAAWSYPSSSGRVMPMIFGQMECWGSTVVKTIKILRLANLE